MSLSNVSTGDPHPAAHNAEREMLNQLETDLKSTIRKPAGAATGDLLRWNGAEWQTTVTRFFEGEGRPDGNFAAPVGSRYIDTTAEQGAVEWVKRFGGDTNLGWHTLAGDTGVRNIQALIEKRNTATVNAARLQRIGHVVDLYLDITMPNNDTSPYMLLTLPAGFRPPFDRYAALQDNSEAAAAGSQVGANGQVNLYKIVAGKRDRFAGTWLTREAWPEQLPGAAG